VHSAAQAPHPGSRVLDVSCLVGPCVVLVGDAGHAITATLGQGCNAALESVALLMAQLDGAGGDVGAALAAYNRERMRDIRALRSLDVSGG